MFSKSSTAKAAAPILSGGQQEKQDTEMFDSAPALNKPRPSSDAASAAARPQGMEGLKHPSTPKASNGRPNSSTEQKLYDMKLGELGIILTHLTKQISVLISISEHEELKMQGNNKSGSDDNRTKREADIDEAEKESTEERDMATEQTVKIEQEATRPDNSSMKAQQVAKELSRKANRRKKDIDALAREADKLKATQESQKDKK